MKNNKNSKLIGVRLTVITQIWENFNLHLRKSSNDQKHHQIQNNPGIRDEIMQDLESRPDRRPIISLPGIPE